MSSRAPFDLYGIRRGVSRDERFAVTTVCRVGAVAGMKRLPDLTLGLSFDPELLRRAPQVDNREQLQERDQHPPSHARCDTIRQWRAPHPPKTSRWMRLPPNRPW